MTIASSRPVECQKCRGQNQVEICESINSHDRNLRDRLLSGALWKWTCTHCAHENVTIYPLLYHDMRAWCLIYYLDRKVTEDPDVIARMVPAPDQLTSLRRFNSNYRFRLCRSLDDFIEKIRILDAGLDDRALEHLKDQAFDRTAHPRFERLTDREAKMLDFATSPSPSRAARTEISFTAYADALAKVKHRLGDDTDPNSGFVVVDHSYIEKRFAEAVPKAKNARAPREVSPADMGSVVFGKSKRFDEPRKPWWRFW